MCALSFDCDSHLDYYNFDTPSYPDNPFETYLNRADVKAALHVSPSFVYSSGNGTVEEYLLADWMQSVQPLVTTLLNNYPVLMYNGQSVRAGIQWGKHQRACGHGEGALCAAQCRVGAVRAILAQWSCLTSLHGKP